MSDDSPRKSKNSKSRGSHAARTVRRSDGASRKAKPAGADGPGKETTSPGSSTEEPEVGSDAKHPSDATGSRGRTNGLVNGTRRGIGLVNGSRGRTNGLVNGTRGPSTGTVKGAAGRTNGLVNGMGRTNGLVNGTRGRTNGLVNGTRGRTNGVRNVQIGVAGERVPPGEVTRRDLRIGIAIIVVSFVIGPTLGYFMGTSPTRLEPVIDGKFLDWAGIPKYSDPKDVRIDSVDLESFALQETPNDLLIYGRTASPLFQGSDPSSVYVFMNPGNQGSGYAAPGISAHYVAELYGWDGQLEGALLREWTGGNDPDNATALIDRGGFSAAVVGGEFELALSDDAVGFRSSPGFQVRLGLTNEEVSDLGATVGLSPGALLIEQRAIASVVSTNGPVLELRMRALGADISLGGISTERIGGGAETLPWLPFTIPSGTERVERIAFDPFGLPPGSFVTLRVTGVTATAAGSGVPAPFTIIGAGVRLYVSAQPAGKAVDGLFDDWSTVLRDADETVADSVDIWESATALTTEAFFYVRMEGQALAGAFLPDRHSPQAFSSTSTNATPAFIPIGREAGEDILRIFVDTDDRTAIGQPVGGLIADRWLEVRGRMGRITSKALHEWNVTRGAWESPSYLFPIALVGSQFEASVPLEFLGVTNNATIAFASSDWKGKGDTTSPSGLRGTRGSPGIVPLHGPGALTIEATLLLNMPTLDGDCDTGGMGEYDGASWDFTADLLFFVGRRDDVRFVFVCLAVTVDFVDNALDWGELLFDTKHDGGLTPQPDDRRFRQYGMGGPFMREMGNGTGWVNCGAICNPGDAATSALSGWGQTFEFRIHYLDVWGRVVPQEHQRAGFAIMAHDEDSFSDYTWGSSLVDQNQPDSWGHIDIPEFTAYAWVAACFVPWALVRRRKRDA